MHYIRTKGEKIKILNTNCSFKIFGRKMGWELSRMWILGKEYGIKE